MTTAEMTSNESPSERVGLYESHMRYDYGTAEVAFCGGRGNKSYTSRLVAPPTTPETVRVFLSSVTCAHHHRVAGSLGGHSRSKS